MLQKKPKSTYWNFIKKGATILFVTEAILFAGSYGIWHRLNTNKDFRYYINENYPIILESYYKFGELLGETKIRKLDNIEWSATKATKKQE